MKSDLPNASQFTPNQISLPELLKIVKAFEPDRKAVSQEILKQFFSDHGSKTEWDWKLADNTVLAMSRYDLGRLSETTSFCSALSWRDIGNLLPFDLY